MNNFVERTKEFWFKYSPKLFSIFKSNKWEYTLDKSETCRNHVYSLFSEQIYNSVEITIGIILENTSPSNLHSYLENVFKELDELSSNPKIENAVHQQRILLLTITCITLNDILFVNLLSLLEEASEQLEFWTDEKVHPYRNIIETGPFQFIGNLFTNFYCSIFGIKQKKKIKNTIKMKIEVLKDFQSTIATHLGRLRRMNANFKDINNSDHLMTYVQDCFQNNSAFFELFDDRLKISLNDKIEIKIISEFCNSLEYFKKMSKSEIMITKPPSYFRRKWLQTTISVGVSGLIGYYVYHHQTEITNWAVKAKDSILDFFQEHLVEPFQSIIKTVLKSYQKSIFNPEELKNAKESMQRMLIDIGTELNNHVTPEELQSIIMKAEKNDVTIFSENYENEIKKPVKNLFVGNIVRMLLIQIQRINVSFLEIMREFDSVMAQNQINLDILATIPVLIGGIAFSSWIRNILKSSGVRPDEYENISLNLRDIEIILNRNCPKDNVSSIVTDEDAGFLISKVLLIEKWLIQAGEQEKVNKMFMSDLKEIDSTNFTVQQKLRDFFRDTGGKITDMRVLRSAMFLSDEIDRAVRGIDLPDQNIGYRQYNRFYAEGTEELFTNIPTGRSPLVLAAPKIPEGTKFTEVSKDKPLPIEYQSMRRSHLKQVGRSLDLIEKSQLKNLQSNGNQVDEKPKIIEIKKDKVIIPKNVGTYKPKVSNDLKVGLYQPFDPKDKSTIKQRLLKFEGEISDRRPDYDYKLDDFEN
eukprot:gene8542-366_t